MMLSQQRSLSLPEKVVPPILVTAPVTAPSDPLKSTTPEQKKRARRGRKSKGQSDSVKPKKSLLLDELSDALVDRFYIPRRDAHSNSSTTSVVDHLRANLHTPVASSNASSISSARTLTAVESSEPTISSDIHSHYTPTLSRQTSFSPSSTAADHAVPNQDPPQNKKFDQGDVVSLDDLATLAAIQQLTAQYGRVAHMGMLDHSYRFFVNTKRTGALSFKVQKRVAIVGGDPLCEPDPAVITELLEEFSVYRRRQRWGIAFMGASESFVRGYGQNRSKEWISIRFGTERVLIPNTNEVLLEKSGKRIAVQNRQLLNPNKGGTTLGLYVPAIHGTDHDLEAELVSIYDAWRAERNNSTGPQAFITVYDPFALPDLMTFVYSCGPNGRINGFAALRRLGCNGYHIDPCIASPESPKGTSDLLIVASMALLHRADVSYLGFGFEPTNNLSSEDVAGMPSALASLTRNFYSRTFMHLPIHGKKAYFDKFRPDPLQESGLYLVFPDGIPGPRHLLAMMHMANISLRKVFWTDLRARFSTCKTKSDPPSDPSVDNVEEKVPAAVTTTE